MDSIQKRIEKLEELHEAKDKATIFVYGDGSRKEGDPPFPYPTDEQKEEAKAAFIAKYPAKNPMVLYWDHERKCFKEV